MSNKLFDGSDEDADDLHINTNENYAKSYNFLRKKELLQKYKDRGLDVSESEFDSDSSSSEEDEVDVKFDQEFFKTLASLKSKNPKIYDKETRFFDDAAEDDEDGEGDGGDGEGAAKKKTSKSKPVTLKDYERKVILEHNGKFESSDDEREADEQNERAQSPTAVEEERRLKAEFSKVMNQEDDGEDEEFGGIFKKRAKTKAQTDAEEADFAKWLAGKQAEIEPEAQEQLAPLKQYWNNSKLTQGESFLRDYILNKGYANTDASEIPTYDEIVGDNAPLSDDEQELEKQAEFEQKYNFRFEEPDADFIKRYPRTIEQSIRRTDDKRKEKRKETKERKEQEKLQMMKELDLIKDMKKKEIEEKIRKLKAVTGNDELGFKDDELEEDFDPEAHDRRMQELFNDEYYNVDEGEEKPECPSDIEELAMEDWDNYDPRQGNDDDDEDLHCEDDEFNMDCDYDPAAAKQQLQQELIENTRSRKGRKGRRNRFMEIIQAEKPVFNPEDEKTYGDYIDEYYQMDYEDIIGDQPCRFKYVETVPNDFGLTIEEILLAKNKELNQWASLKKAVQNRPDYVEKKEQRLYKLKAKNEDLKRKIFKSLYGDGSDDEEQTELTEAQAVTSTDSTETPAASSEAAPAVASTEVLSKSKRKRLKRKAAATAASTNGQAKPSEGAEEAANTEKPLTATEQQPPAAEQQQSPLKDVPTPPKKNQAEKPQKQQLNSSVKNGATPAKKNQVEKKPQKQQLNTSVEDGATPAKKKKLEKKPQKVQQTSSAKRPKLVEQPEPGKQEGTKPNTNNPFAKPQNPNKNDGKPFLPPNNRFKNKQNGAKAGQVERASGFKQNGAKAGAVSGGNPFTRKTDAPRPGGGSFQARGKRDFKGKPNNSQAKRDFKGKPNNPQAKRDFKAKGKPNKDNPNGLSDDRLKAYGINPRKFRNQQKYGKKKE